MAQFAQTPGQTGGFLQQLLAPEVAMPMAAALMGNQGNAANFGNAFGAYGQAVAQRAGQNKTLEYFRQNAPEFAAMVEAGMPVSDAWQTYTKQRYAQKAGPTYGLTPIYGTDEQGNTVLGTLGNDGSFKRIETGDFRVSTGVDKVDLGTHYGLVDKRTGATVGTLPKENFQEAYDKSAGGVAGKMQAEAVANLPKVEQQAQTMLDTLDALEKHPGFKGAVGWQGNIPDWMIPSGTDAAGFMTLLDQSMGQSFLQAFESLRGGGQISNVEGQQATRALNRLSRSLSEAEFKQALNELRTIIRRGLERARAGIVVNDSPGGAPQTAPGPAAPGAPASSGNRTRSGISWSVEP